ncbi:SOS response-associated peptidase [Pseudoxanthomonas sp. SL93]|uniref:SOS response-associated peptidase n=1 Tax=Pseudoxanthomonas sp. SL93 TaxID=2995142 RepID=UPI00226EDCAC|nr:SOS response-associated peptidase [Pseudoxanthomonas sp. SL93]WAC64040.1 SOS response-associated peptidase [Pseudoxanthomonas sp. SL93]
MRRFAQAIADRDQLAESIPEAIAQAIADDQDRYNIGKGKPANVIAMTDNRLVVLIDMVWGLVPRWSKEPTTHYTTVTARLERAPKSRIFAQAWKERHCLVPMSGYFKWDRQRKPPWPHFIQTRDGSALLAAGLWERWEGEDGTSLLSFAVLTAPNLAIPSPLTQDGPIFLEGKNAIRWLTGSISSPRSLLRHAHVPSLESYTVGRAIAKADVDDYTLLEPVDPAEKGPEPTDEDEDWEDD